MLSGVWHSAVLGIWYIAYYTVDAWLEHRLSVPGGKRRYRSWGDTAIVFTMIVLIVVQPTLLPGLGLLTHAWWGLAMQVLGFALIAGALGLHWWARVHLGRFFSEQVQVQANQGVVESGPYRYVRHPIYTAFFLLAVGYLLAAPSPFTLAAVMWAVVRFVPLAIREEKLLSENLPGYAEYAARTPRFVPRLRRQ